MFLSSIWMVDQIIEAQGSGYHFLAAHLAAAKTIAARTAPGHFGLHILPQAGAFVP